MNMLSTMSQNVLLSPLILFTKVIASIMHADGKGIDSAGATLISICRAREDLFVFLRAPSHLDNGQGNGPKRCLKRPKFPYIQITTSCIQNNISKQLLHYKEIFAIY